jgi:hypothetical protein
LVDRSPENDSTRSARARKDRQRHDGADSGQRLKPQKRTALSSERRDRTPHKIHFIEVDDTTAASLYRIPDNI